MNMIKKISNERFQERSESLASAKKPYGSVLIKAVQILDLLSQRSEPQTMSEISKYTDITMSTTNKILDTLDLIGFVSRDSQTKEFSLGPRLIQLANASFIQFDIARETYPTLKRLYERVNTTVNLGMHQDNQVLFVNKFTERDSSEETISRIGFTQPIYCTAMGKAILAKFSKEEREEYLKRVELTPKTEHTIINKEILEDEIKLTQQRGYAIDDREAEDNIYCIGTTFQVLGDSNYYAFSISSPYDQVDGGCHDHIVSELMKTKTVIEYQLANAQEG